MAAGTKYNITPEYKPEEIYRVETGVRKSGPWKLDVSNLPEGAILPVFTPVHADVKTRIVTPVRNFSVMFSRGPVAGEDGALSTDDYISVGSNPLAYVGMTLMDANGNTAEVTGVEKKADEYWLELSKALDYSEGPLVVEGQDPANFVLYEQKKVELDGPVLCTLLMQAYEVKESKLIIPITESDKETLTSRFQFE